VLTEVYATNVDAAGTDLRWVRVVPSTGGPTWPAVLVIHGGGYQTGHPEVYICRDLADAGFLALGIEYRLAPPHTTMSDAGPPGDPQFDPPSDGRPTQQTDDVQRAIRAARADPQCNGKVDAVGGSAGAAHTAWWGIAGTTGDDRLDALAGLSGSYDLDSADGLALNEFRGAVETYLNHTTDEGQTFHDAARAASPYWLTPSGTPAPCLFFHSQTENSVPQSIFDNMVTKMTNAGATTESHLRTGDVLHSFDYWYLGYGGSFSTVKECTIDFFNRMLKITLTARGYKVHGRQTADVSWSGATSSNVDIYRNGVQIVTTANDRLYTDSIGGRGHATYTYQVCNAGTQTCSNQATVTF
jgi:acetyl esterase/lipase